MINEAAGQLNYVSTKSEDDEKWWNKYLPKFIARLLREKDPNGKALFYFKNRNDYIALFSNGHLNVRGEEDMFRAWVNSEFKDLEPQSIFKELEKDIAEISFIANSDKSSCSFNSYNEFIRWLTHKDSKE
jgi:hypothetical protein